MTNPRELLARLNPTTIRYDVGRGGVGALSNQDIAAALAFVPAGLGREVLEACWWPDGAARRSHKLRDAVYMHVQPEIARQAKELSEARIHRGMLHACAGWANNPGAGLLRELAAAEAKVEAIKARCWPVSAFEMLPAMSKAVIDELAHPNQCPDCKGRGQLRAGELVVTCPTCGGRGTLAISDRKRAAAIGRDKATYRVVWRPMYEWMIREFGDAEQEAARHLSAALRDAA
ncbi:hypothetical protein CSC70_03890 [Pseudoxanthomonas kalamensis DSM 18571]|uniref:zinc finger-like domain-containing protein n=1 Tax=Pseudoxanthomonas kalamensis TaxID=289483 RepID=UPI00139186C4|nr:zinc finger-like domain-containing protein [Pseudoxanthomonas kalamensis]KAF1711077.1 hypothetical protein CSC70_03890 [Pseudoxanthomonas kalamensis DSM 18571]